jgi:hypothetical protein
MKKLMTLVLGLSLFAGATAVVFAQDKMDDTTKKTTKTKKSKKAKKTDTTATTK